jgi:hypothetical protein
MAEAIRYHLDEHIATAVAVGLRSRGIDVTTTLDAQLTAASDLEQLAYAHGAGRVLVTHDADFLRLHREGVEHGGVVYSEQRKTSIGDLIRGLVLIHAVLAPEDMDNHVEFL